MIVVLTTLLVADMYSCKFSWCSRAMSGWRCQILLQVFECLLCLLNPLELVMFLKELKERESPDAESRDKPAQSDHASRQLLHVMEALGWLYFGDS
jgi:hypothetical protein